METLSWTSSSQAPPVLQTHSILGRDAYVSGLFLYHVTVPGTEAHRGHGRGTITSIYI